MRSPNDFIEVTIEDLHMIKDLQFRISWGRDLGSFKIDDIYIETIVYLSIRNPILILCPEYKTLRSKRLVKLIYE